MDLGTSERFYLERQVMLARAVFAALALVALLETSPAPPESGILTAAGVPFVFLSAYLLLAAAALAARGESRGPWRIPFALDFLVLGAFLYLTPSLLAFWFLFLFAVFALASFGRKHSILILVAAATAGVVLRIALADPLRWRNAGHWIAVGFAMLVSGLCMGFLGARERAFLEHQRFLERVSGTLQFERGLNESIRQLLREIGIAFSSDQACLAVRDDELERIFLWKLRLFDPARAGPETLALSRADTFLLDSLEVSLAWHFSNGSQAGFGWDRRTGKPFRELPPPPDSTREEFKAQSLVAVTIEYAGQPSGRVLLIRSGAAEMPPRRSFTRAELRALEQVVRHIAPPLENVFLMRNLRSRAVEAERSRMSRDLHDGILQTLLSLNLQLDVLRRRAAKDGEKRKDSDGLASELTRLQNLIQQESLELRRVVTDMRPLRIESADLRELMTGFAERFRNENGLAVDLFIEDRNLRLPDRVCRELFQIYRESLHNIKKHANASHVVVKLAQDEAKVSLVVDDNGRGFSFGGRYASEELDRLRLGPISIKERTRSVGGTLTVESNPGHGARLTIEIPLN